MPNPTDPSFEVLNNYNNDNCSMDVFFALSHGVHRGSLRPGKYDEREDYIYQLKKICKNIKFDTYGMFGRQPVWGDEFLKKLSNSKMGLNLSRGNPVKYYSSDRIAQLMGNGLLTLIHKDTKFSDFFNNDEMIFYKDIHDLSDKIKRFTSNDKDWRKIAQKGHKKYHK